MSVNVVDIMKITFEIVFQRRGIFKFRNLETLIWQNLHSKYKMPQEYAL